MPSFLKTSIGKTLNIDQLNQVVSSDSTITVKATKFAIIGRKLHIHPKS